jgi:sec-independent protein translocase protein TatC
MAPLGAAPQKPDPQTDSGQMPFLAHLEELRKRLIYVCIGVGVGAGIAFAFIQPIFDFIIGPLMALLPPGSHFISTRPAEMFGVYVQIALIAATVLAAPWIMYQVWRFIAPGLYRHEKRYVIPFVALTSVGFVGGALFNHYVAFRLVMTFFAGLSTDAVRFTPSIEPVFGLYVRMLFGMGLVFQMPTMAFFLARMGLITARTLVRHAKHAVMVMVIAAAVVTPSPDVWNQLIVAGTMMVLYALCIGIVALVGRERRNKATANGAAILVFPAGWWYLKGDRTQRIPGSARHRHPHAGRRH